MKSIKSDGAATCPNGCEPFDAEFWTFIRADLDAELKDAVLGGEINLVRCPCCGLYFYHNRTLVYFDPTIELMAFVCAAGGNKSKIKNDFKLMKENIKSVNIDYEPFYFDNLEELKAMAAYEDNAALQSEVIAAHSAGKGYKIAALKRSSARLKRYPYYIPVATEEYGAKSVLSAAREILKENPGLAMLSSLVKDLENGAPLPPRI